MTTATKTISVAEYELGKLAERFENRSIEELLEWAAERFAPRLVMTSNFGAEGVVLIDHLARVAPKTPIIYLSTGFQFAETDELKERLRERYDLNIIQAEADLTVEEQNRIHGERLYEMNSDQCCRLRKVEPLQKALAGYDGWIAALRRDQSPTRANIKTIEWNARNNLVKIHPLANWTRASVWNYILKHNLPYNRLHNEGYTSIGCRPCTRPVSIGAHERSGRWNGSKKECGIHL
ncbi:MAG TPA: phosphoadenylyl-sulfate reductase [Blastocatellia bacterium]|nr:phosphoadenylyl-sulfate reductase [Blastocatellia bacterium]HMV87378.1 phosphoadenylyl-sulfate reductase [Blastocatellia bacterium]HMX24932.1 phosphoadenylyl-sulfate reductase [Blastocatellia bacterium]HMY75486.1 phosphoadenylyl-sulfate reductase [Blastocatellia bacterium]HMZ17967.1 phosphoadenylyl-sulfate reductase [Blastocatellia bacterium]